MKSPGETIAVPTRQLPPAWIAIALSATLHVILWPTVPIDVTIFLRPWYDHILAAGPVGAFAEPFSNYNPPYLYLLAITTLFDRIAPAAALIKALSIAGTVVLALAVRRLLISLGNGESVQGAALIFMVPSVLANAVVLSQCDAMWAAACVMALVYAVERRHVAMLAWCGVAIAFKLQAVFVAPLFLALLLQRRVPIATWCVAPAVMVALLVPAALAGWPPADLATIYLRQSQTMPGIVFNAPNIWSIVAGLPGAGALPLTGIAFALTAAATAAYVAHFSRHALAGADIVAAALLATLIVAGLLPSMHERYFFLADITALVLAIVRQDARSWRIAGLVQIGSVLALLAYMSGAAVLAIFGGAAMTAATVMLLVGLSTRPARSPDIVTSLA